MLDFEQRLRLEAVRPTAVAEPALGISR
jgi:hypothetical protein